MDIENEYQNNIDVLGDDHFEKKGASCNESQYNIFCKKWVFEYFLFNNFLEKTIFSKITAKNNFWKAWPLLREIGVRQQKWI